MLTSCWGVIATAANIPDGTNPDYTVDDYRADMPALADSIPEHLLAEYVQMAHSVVREARWHGYWRQGMRLFISHFAALYAAATPSDGDTASIAAIESNIGTIDQVAEALQATVPPEEMQRIAIRNRQRTILIVGAIILFSLLMLFLAIFIFCNGPFYVVETIQEG